jgi:hypothetical protein
LAIPISTITAISEKYRWTPHLEAVADLVVIAFLYIWMGVLANHLGSSNHFGFSSRNYRQSLVLPLL